MSAIGSEIRKLTTTRTTWVVTAVGLVLTAVSTAFMVFEEEFTGPFLGTDAEVASVIDQIGSTSVIVLVVGVLSMTTEFRYGTIGRTLQLTPSRSRLLSSKVVVGALYGILFFVLGLVLVAAVLAVVAATGDLSPTVGPEVRTALWQGPAGLALTAVLGVALGALIRSQVVAVTVLLVWVFIGETLFVQFLPRFGRWLPFQALQSIFLSDEVMANVPDGMLSPLEPLIGLAVFVAYVIVASVAATLLLRYRDV